MSLTYKKLFESIRHKCEQEHWFGPELLSPTNRMHVPANDPNRFGFVFPPANEEQLEQAEKKIGFSLPPLLRALYKEIANGGFGPGAGLESAFDGYGEPGTGIYPDINCTIIAQYHWRSPKRTFDLSEYIKLEEQQNTHIDLEVPHGEWLKHLLPICDLGCVLEVCVDPQERMFIVAPLDSDDSYWLYQLPWNFEEWLWRWVRGEELMVHSLN